MAKINPLGVIFSRTHADLMVHPKGAPYGDQWSPLSTEGAAREKKNKSRPAMGTPMWGAHMGAHWGTHLRHDNGHPT